MISLKNAIGYLRKKGRNTGGFTLTEMLVVVLLIGLLGTVTAAGIPAIRESYRNVKMRANAQTLLSTSISRTTDIFRNADLSTTDGNSKEPVFLDGRNGVPVKLMTVKEIFSTDDIGNSPGVIVEQYVIRDENGDYKADEDNQVMLLTEKTISDGMKQSLTYSYDTEKGFFSGEITIYNSSGHKIVSQSFKVRPLNN
ncbi:prepilin-type N-terminal cleavage/methylation domain-containing protein [Baileyella intestinalis]|uniref:prepilin-type N-terminal cleavage/methylation domain-containing protein n=1 Tax=Baileyella intestinalis TaxID=2606709 RepID=UPI0022E23174|nr:prepilin-type N-terminal cleavage/methylation domain-containing protein [Baileyella intestinalis]